MSVGGGGRNALTFMPALLPTLRNEEAVVPVAYTNGLPGRSICPSRRPAGCPAVAMTAGAGAPAATQAWPTSNRTKPVTSMPASASTCLTVFLLSATDACSNST